MGTRASSGDSADFEAACAELHAIVGAEHILNSTPEDAVDGVLPQIIIEPANAEELAQTLKIAAGAGLQVIPRGGASKMDWGNPPRGGQLILSTRRLNRIAEHAWADMTATVEAGCTVQRLQETLAEHGQRLALDPLWPERATIGGALATNDSGPLRLRFGSLRDLIIGITLALADGTLAKSGGKVVKNVAGYDLPKLATGSLGTLGIITQAIFRLHPIPRASRTLSFSAGDSESTNALVLAILDSKLVPTGLQVRTGSSAPPEVDLRFEGTAAGCEAQIEQALRIASGACRLKSPADAWKTHAMLWGTQPSVICKFSLLPTNLGAFLDRVNTASQASNVPWRIVAQAVGVGLLRLEGADSLVLLPILRELREHLEQRSSSLVLLRCPLEIKRQMDVWGDAGDALQLMKNIKVQLDSQAVLNPGRFVGGI
jgi:glycolate oxidase FAD binding subunit